MQFLIPPIVAITLVVLGFSYLLQAPRWIQFTRHTMDHPERFFPGAIVMVAAGASIAMAYDNWSSTWPAFVTFLGWLLAIKGGLMLVFPGFSQGFRNLSDRFLLWYMRCGGVLLIVLGGLLWRHFA